MDENKRRDKKIAEISDKFIEDATDVMVLGTIQGLYMYALSLKQYIRDIKLENKHTHKYYNFIEKMEKNSEMLRYFSSDFFKNLNFGNMVMKHYEKIGIVDESKSKLFFFDKEKCDKHFLFLNELKKIYESNKTTTEKNIKNCTNQILLNILVPFTLVYAYEGIYQINVDQYRLIYYDKVIKIQRSIRETGDDNCNVMATFVKNFYDEKYGKKLCDNISLNINTVVDINHTFATIHKDYYDKLIGPNLSRDDVEYFRSTWNHYNNCTPERMEELHKKVKLLPDEKIPSDSKLKCIHMLKRSATPAIELNEVSVAVRDKKMNAINPCIINLSKQWNLLTRNSTYNINVFYEKLIKIKRKPELPDVKDIMNPIDQYNIKYKTCMRYINNDIKIFLDMTQPTINIIHSENINDIHLTNAATDIYRGANPCMKILSAIVSNLNKLFKFDSNIEKIDKISLSEINNYLIHDEERKLLIREKLKMEKNITTKYIRLISVELLTIDKSLKASPDLRTSTALNYSVEILNRVTEYYSGINTRIDDFIKSLERNDNTPHVLLREITAQKNHFVRLDLKYYECFKNDNMLHQFVELYVATGVFLRNANIGVSPVDSRFFTDSMLHKIYRIIYNDTFSSGVYELHDSIIHPILCDIYKDINSFRDSIIHKKHVSITQKLKCMKHFEFMLEYVGKCTSGMAEMKNFNYEEDDDEDGEEDGEEDEEEEDEEDTKDDKKKNAKKDAHYRKYMKYKMKYIKLKRTI